MNVLTAPTNLGNRPYETDGTARHTHLGPARLRERGVVQRLRARDLGDVPAKAYRDLVRDKPVRNEDLVLEHSKAIADALRQADGFTVVLGGDCSTLPGCLLGVKDGRGEIGLVFFDGHTDLNTPATSPTGGVAGMDLALVTGRGDTPLARLDPLGPLVRDEHVVTVGIREGTLEGTGIRAATSASEILELLGDRDFFIHVDADVLDPEHMPFVDTPEPNGLHPDELTAMLRQLSSHPRALGMEFTIYDPRDDHDGRGAELLVTMLEKALAGR